MNYDDREVYFKDFNNVLPSDSLEICGSVDATHVLPANEAENRDLIAFMDSEGLTAASINLNDADQEGVWVGNDGAPTTQWRNWVDVNWRDPEYFNYECVYVSDCGVPLYEDSELDYALIDNTDHKGAWLVSPNIPSNVICYKPVP